MPNPYTPRRCARRATRPGLAAVVSLLLGVLLLLTSLLVSGCGSSAGGADTTSGPVQTDASSTTAAVEEVTPEGLATDVTDTWAEAMQELVALLQGKPEVAVIQPEVQALKEEYIQTLVELGRQRETLSTADKDRANSLEMLAFDDMADETWYTAFSPLWSYYADIDLELANLVASFNYLTQYSDFELLKKQAPEEAARLGVD